METQVKKISPRRTRAYAATTLAIVLVAAACGGENNADPPATSAAVPNTTPSTILPPATDPAPTTTAPAPTTTPTVPTPPTTTQLSEEDQAKQAVIEAAENAWYVFNEAKLDPTNDEKRRAAHRCIHGRRAQLECDDIAERLPDHEPQSSHVVRVSRDRRGRRRAPSTSTSQSGTATRRALQSRLERHGRGRRQPRWPDRVLDDNVTAYHELETTFQLVDGAWLQSDGDECWSVSTGALTCDATLIALAVGTVDRYCCGMLALDGASRGRSVQVPARPSPRLSRCLLVVLVGMVSPAPDTPDHEPPPCVSTPSAADAELAARFDMLQHHTPSASGVVDVRYYSEAELAPPLQRRTWSLRATASHHL